MSENIAPRADMGRSASLRESSWIVQILGGAIFGSSADSGWKQTDASLHRDWSIAKSSAL